MPKLLPLAKNSELWCIHDSEADDFFNIFYNILRCMDENGAFDRIMLESMYFVASYRNALLHKIVTEDKLFAILNGRIDTEGKQIQNPWLMNYVTKHVKIGKALPASEYYLKASTAGSLNYPDRIKLDSLSIEFKLRYKSLMNQQQKLTIDEYYCHPSQLRELSKRMENNSCEVQVTAAWDDVPEIIYALSHKDKTKHLLTSTAGNDSSGQLSFNSLVSPIAFSRGLELLADANNIEHALVSSACISRMTAEHNVKVATSFNPVNAPSMLTAIIDGLVQQDAFITNLMSLSRSWNEHIVKELTARKPDHPVIADINNFKLTQFCPADLIVAIISSQRANHVAVPEIEKNIVCQIPTREGEERGQVLYKTVLSKDGITKIIQPHDISDALVNFGRVITTYVKTAPSREYKDCLRFQAELLVAAIVAIGKEPEDLLDQISQDPPPGLLPNKKLRL